MLEAIRKKLFGERLSKQNAKNRLQMVLVQDRSGLNSQKMENFRKDLFNVLKRYFVLEQNNLEIDWQRDGNCTALVINTPIIGKKDGVKDKKLANV